MVDDGANLFLIGNTKSVLINECNIYSQIELALLALSHQFVCEFVTSFKQERKRLALSVKAFFGKISNNWARFGRLGTIMVYV